MNEERKEAIKGRQEAKEGRKKERMHRINKRTDKRLKENK